MVRGLGRSTRIVRMAEAMTEAPETDAGAKKRTWSVEGAVAVSRLTVSPVMAMQPAVNRIAFASRSRCVASWISTWPFGFLVVKGPCFHFLSIGWANCRSKIST